MRKQIKETIRRSIALLLAFSMALPMSGRLSLIETKAATAAELKEGIYYEIISKSSGKALTVSGYSTANDAGIITMTANQYESQIWTLDDAGDGYYQIVNYHSGKSMNVPWASTEEGTQIIQFNKGNDNNAKWMITDTTEGYCRITPYLVDTFGLNIEGNSDGNNAAIIQWTYAGADNEQWEFREVAVQDIKSNPEMEIPDPKVAVDAWIDKFYYTEEKNGEILGRMSNTSGFWTDAEILEVFIDAYEELGDSKYIEVAEQFYASFVSRHSKDWAWNEYNDDVFWMALATVRLYLSTGKQEYLDVAEYNFNLAYDRAWDEEYFGGGLWWKTDKETKNGCVNGPGALAAYLLGEATGDNTYKEKAKKIIDWMIDVLLKDNGSIIDHIKKDGTIFDSYISTGNQGNFMGAAAMVYKYTGDQKYLDAAKLAADYTITMGDGDEGYLNREWHERDGCGGKGILGRWFSYFTQECNVAAYDQWILNNGMSAWFNRNSDNLMYSAFGRTTEDNIENSETLMENDTPMKEFAAWSCSAAVAWVLNMTYPAVEEEYTLYTMEGESGNLINGAASVSADECSNGAYAGNIGGTGKGTIEFTVYSDVDSTRKMNIYYATATQRSFSIIVNDNVQTVVCDSTGGWGTPNTTPIEITVDLKQGANVIQFTGVDEGNAPNLDRFQIQLTNDEVTETERIKESKLRITCVGDSITDGIGASSGATTYPSQLQLMLGTTDYVVSEYGASGAFACESTDLCWFPYTTSNEYQQSLVSNPDIVIILIGTNDAAESMCWGKIDQGIDVESAFRQGYENLINTYLNLESKPRVILGTPLTSVNSDNREENNTNGTIPIIKDLADKYDLTLLDLHSYTADWTNDNYLDDGLHPNDAGYKILAEQFSIAVKNEAGALSEVTLDGTSFTEFDTNKNEYEVMYTGNIPQLGVTVSNAKVNTTVVQADVGNQLASVQVSTATGALLKTYTFNFINVENYTTFTMEAENAVLSGGANIVNAEECSNGQYVGAVGGGSGVVTFNLNATSSGQKELKVYYATYTQRQISVTVNGNAVGTLICPGTGDWGTPSTEPQTVYVTLSEGVNTIQLSGVDTAYAPNIDKIEIVGEGEITVVEEITTEAPTETTTETPTTEPSAETPGEVFGMVASSNAQGTITVVWGNDPNIYKGETYNIYVDGEKKLSNVACASYDITGIAGGTHTVKVTAVLNNIETTGVTMNVTVEAKTEPQVAVEINGFQISTTAEGYRTVYSVSDTDEAVAEVGIVYGLTDYVTETDMIVGSSNSTVYEYVATEAGKMDTTVSEMESAASYTMTMRFIKTAEFYNAGISVRAYAKLTDGTYVYSDIETTSVYEIAEELYANVSMNTLDGHNYLYNNILSVVTPGFKEVEFNWNNSIVGA